MSQQINHTFTDEIVCPYCGEEYSDSWEMGMCAGRPQEHEGTFVCDECGVIFKWEREIKAHYTTQKRGKNE